MFSRGSEGTCLWLTPHPPLLKQVPREAMILAQQRSLDCGKKSYSRTPDGRSVKGADKTVAGGRSVGGLGLRLGKGELTSRRPVRAGAGSEDENTRMSAGECEAKSGEVVSGNRGSREERGKVTKRRFSSS